MKHLKLRWELPVVFIASALLFILLFHADNKYEAPPPYGNAGVLTLTEKHLEQSCPLYLIDGWLLTDERVTDKPTYIGEFSSLQRSDRSVSPHGRAIYRIVLRYNGAPQVAEIDFPALSFCYAISLDGTRLTSGTGNGQITFQLTPGDHTLTVETVSKVGYYSGMYFPPALGTPRTLARVENLQSFAYALAFLLPLALAVFTLFLWRTGGALSRWFGGLCCCYALYVSHYFVRLFHLPLSEYWFFVESLSFCGLCFCVVRLIALAAQAEKSGLYRWIRRGLLLLPVCLLMLALLIPALSWAVALHGRLTDLYYSFTFGCTAYFAVCGAANQGWESRYTLAGCAVFGAGLAVNLLFSNRFEPIRFLWQFEWCGLFLVLLFGGMMAARNRRILRENTELTNHLEQMVEKRTAELAQLLEERKAFFSDMAHDLKAPVFATQSFIAAIRAGGVGVDSELRGYLDQAEGKQREMARRLQGLSTINALDRIEGEKGKINLRELLEEVYATHHGEAEVQSVHLTVHLPEGEHFILAQPEKLDILFENLIYNALRATPPDGRITVCAEITNGRVRITITDTGCGIPEEELPHIFDRFFVGRQNKATGTGLGLYIVSAIVKELGGSISAFSRPDEGTSFMMEFPLADTIS